jgi:hypothetical protein
LLQTADELIDSMQNRACAMKFGTGNCRRHYLGYSESPPNYIFCVTWVCQVFSDT